MQTAHQVTWKRHALPSPGPEWAVVLVSVPPRGLPSAPSSPLCCFAATFLRLSRGSVCAFAVRVDMWDLTRTVLMSTEELYLFKKPPRLFMASCCHVSGWANEWKETKGLSDDFPSLQPRAPVLSRPLFLLTSTHAPSEGARLAVLEDARGAVNRSLNRE